MIHFLGALLFSQPQDLGWDLTATLVPGPDGDPQYEFIVEGADGTQTRYRTLELIVAAPKEPTNGRGTWVWRVIELRDGIPSGDPVVLKDVWRHGELAQEGTIIESIHDSDLGDTERSLLRDHLLTVLPHGDVVIRPMTCDGVPHLDSTQTHARNFEALRAGQPVDEPRLLPLGTRLGP